MDSKQAILNALATEHQGPTPLPPLDEAWVQYDDVLRQLTETVALVGGQVETVPDETQCRATIEQRDIFRQATTVYSLLPGIRSSPADLPARADRHELRTVDLALVPGAFAVAENGAVWVTDEEVHQRALLFLAEHLVLVVPRDQIVHNLHEAYARLVLDELRFGVLISGPSKTADIEQTLVIGAQGPRSLTLVLVGSD